MGGSEELTFSEREVCGGWGGVFGTLGEEGYRMDGWDRWKRVCEARQR